MTGFRRSDGDAYKVIKDPATDFEVIENNEDEDESRVTTICRLMRGSLNVNVRPRMNTKVRKQTMEELETDKRRSGKWIYMIRKL